MSDGGYQDRVAQQIRQYADLGVLWPLPAVMNYWMSKHIMPRFRDVFALPGIFVLYYERVAEAARRRHAIGKEAVVYSIGAGDCKVEIDLAKRLKAAGIGNVVIVATELSRPRLDRAAMAAIAAGVGDYFDFQVMDLNDARIDQEVDVVIAHHTLHHIVNLEGLFDRVRAAMHDDGVFLTADIIGRNGHQRWPETLQWIERLWGFIPHHFKYNFQFNAVHETYLDWDCSGSGFEGVRAQDVLPLLVERFVFEGFLGYGGIIDPFVERGYGRNIDPARPADCAFIDFVEALNQTLLETGRIKPTMMMAAMRKKAVPVRHFGPLSPQFSIRPAAAP